MKFLIPFKHKLLKIESKYQDFLIEEQNSGCMSNLEFDMGV